MMLEDAKRCPRHKRQKALNEVAIKYLSPNTKGSDNP
jgi:hypothetical protein